MLHSRSAAFNGQEVSKALPEYEKCIPLQVLRLRRGPSRKHIFDLQRKGIELERTKSILVEGAELSEKKVLQ